MPDLFTLDDLTYNIPSQVENDPTNPIEGEDDGETE
tara:strand:- start:3453 stop:3560 length:108 start_codon:yes stop_codon:yes gene_type:complete